MTISTTSNTAVCQGNGLTTSFDFSFPVPLASELFVYYTNPSGTIIPVPSNAYSTTGIGTSNGGTVTYPLTGSPIPQGSTLTIQRIVPYQQLTSLVNQSGYYPNVVENALDLLTMMCQQLAQAQMLTIQVPIAASSPDLILPSAPGRANTLVGFDANGNVITYPVSAPIGAGSLTAEYGRGGTPGFKSGVDFTGGTTQSLTLSKAYGSIANVQVFFDTLYVEKDALSLVGNVLTYGSYVGGVFTPAAIPASVQNVDVIGGTTLSAYIPSTGSVGPQQLAVGAVGDVAISSTSNLYQRSIAYASPMDPAYGAKFDGATDDTTAIQNCISNNPYVQFPRGKKARTTATIVVPTTCLGIDADTAQLVGPGETSGVDAFSFTNFYQAGGTIFPIGERYVLPSVSGYRNAVYLHNSAFLRIYVDTIQDCEEGFFVTCDSSANYCFELELGVRFAFHLRNSGKGAAFYLQSTGNSNNAFQGLECRAFYVDDVDAAVYQEFSSSGTNGNINNVFDVVECDQSSYAVYCTQNNCTSANLYRFPAGLTSMGNAQPFVNIGSLDMVEVGGARTNDPTIFAANNFQAPGCAPRLGIAVQAAGIPTLYVDPGGSDTTGTGNSTSPFATIQHALNELMKLDLFGQTAYIAVRNGTYSAGGLMNAVGAAGANGTIAIIGNIANPAAVVINAVGGVAFSANGSGACLELSGMTINGGVLAQNNGQLQIGPDLVFGTNTGGIHINAQLGGVVSLNSNYSVTGASSYHYVATLGGVIQNNAATAISFTGTLPFTTVADASQGGQLSLAGITYTGASVSGQKYAAQLGGGIFTNGGGAGYFPGTVAGAATSPGWYA